MVNQVVFNTIKNTVHAFLPQAKVLLFGSRARGDFKDRSDFDLLIITDTGMADSEKAIWRNRINKELVHKLQVPFDVLINSDSEIDQKRTFPGHIVQWALKEGVWL